MVLISIALGITRAVFSLTMLVTSFHRKRTWSRKRQYSIVRCSTYYLEEICSNQSPRMWNVIPRTCDCLMVNDNSNQSPKNHMQRLFLEVVYKKCWILVIGSKSGSQKLKLDFELWKTVEVQIKNPTFILEKLRSRFWNVVMHLL